MRKTARKRAILIATAAAVVVFAGIVLWAYPLRGGPQFTLRWGSIGAGGGGTQTGGPFTATVTVGQNVAGSVTGGPFTGGSGNWTVSQQITCGDLDTDGDVDLKDYAGFTLCIGDGFDLIGANCPPQYDADCDRDGDVDLDDYLSFDATITGPGSAN